MTCRCHAGPLYATLHDCPRCGHRSLDHVGGWVGCERRACGYQNSADEQLQLEEPDPDDDGTFDWWVRQQRPEHKEEEK